MSEARTARGIQGFLVRRWETLLAGIIAFAVAGLLVFAAIVAVPPMLHNLSAATSDGVTAVALSGGTGGVVVPEGWHVQRGGDAPLDVHTPDRVLAVAFSVADGEPGAVLRAMLDEAGAAGPVRTETLATGLRLIHADVGEDQLYAVVATAEGGAVRVVARVSEEGDLHAYRAALAQLLEGVRP